MPFLDPLIEQQLPKDHPRYKNGEGSELHEVMRYRWVRKNKIFTCEKGTISDGASIPEIVPDVALNDHGRVRKPAYPHDDIYNTYTDLDSYSREIWEIKHDVWTKKEADLMFLDSMKDENMHPVKVQVIYLAVRLNLKAKWNWGKTL